MISVKGFKWIGAGVALGSVLGYCYYYFIGCSEGCAITSSPVNSVIYGGIMGGLFFNIFKKQKRIMNHTDHKTVIDVRTRGEFSGGNIKGSVNIPLQDIPNKVKEIKKMAQPILLCCASGGRSEQATRFLRAQGIECDNGGGWMEAEHFLNQK